MANANLSLITLSNTFQQWMISDNNLINVANELINGNYYKDNGNMYLPNGTFFITSTSGTGLSVTNSVLFSLLTTMNTSITSGLASFLGNVLMSNSAATCTIDGNLVVDGNTVLGNLQVNGTQTIVGNTVTSSATILLRTSLSTSGNGSIVVEQGTTNGNAAIQYTQTSGVWQATSNDQLGLLSTLILASNIADTVFSNSKINVASANAVEWAYNTAAQAYTTANLAYAAANSGLSSGAAYNQANNAYAEANAAYATANVANSTANLAYAKANAAATAGGANTQIQFNNNGALAGSANLTFNLFSNVITFGGMVIGNQDFNGAGVATFMANAPTSPMYRLFTSGAAANGKSWRMYANSAAGSNSSFHLDIEDDLGAFAGHSVLQANRAAQNVTSISYGNPSDPVVHNFQNNGSGALQYNGNDIMSAIASAANTVQLSNNNSLVISAQRLNFINSPTMNAVVTAFGTVSFNYNPSGGPAGPQGPTGATGATGSTGPAGPSNIINATGSQSFNMYPVGVTGFGTPATPIVNTLFLLQANGQMHAVDYAATSDATLKDIQAPISGAIEIVKSITGYKYTWNSEAKALGINDTSTQVGVLAQDVQVLYPEAVNAHGNAGKMSVSYDKLVPLLLEAIKEQQRQIDSLQSQIQRLQ